MLLHSIRQFRTLKSFLLSFRFVVQPCRDLCRTHLDNSLTHFQKCFILLRVAADPDVYPGNTGHEAGICPECDASPSQGTKTHIHTNNHSFILGRWDRTREAGGNLQLHQESAHVWNLHRNSNLSSGWNQEPWSHATIS